MGKRIKATFAHISSNWKRRRRVHEWRGAFIIKGPLLCLCVFRTNIGCRESGRVAPSPDIGYHVATLLCVNSKVKAINLLLGPLESITKEEEEEAMPKTKYTNQHRQFRFYSFVY